MQPPSEHHSTPRRPVRGRRGDPRRRLLALAAAALAAAAFLLAGGATGAPASLTVTRLDDPLGAGSCPSDCSLRQALAAIAAGGTITLPAGTYVLSQGELLTTGSVTIAGAGAFETTIEGVGGDRVLEVAGGDTVTLSAVTITGGASLLSDTDTDPGEGGGVLADPGASLTISDAMLTNNTAATDGGAVAVEGTIGGPGGALTLVASTIEGNTASSTGGGVFVAGPASASITNSTIVSNNAVEGGGIGAGGTTNLASDTLTDNDASSSGAGDETFGAQAIVAENTIFNDPESGQTGFAGNACDSAVTDLGHNLQYDPSASTSCALTPDLGDVVGANPELNAPGDNGGPTTTVAPSLGSPVVGAANSADCPAIDQRGVSRPAGACDIGAFQGVQGPFVASESATAVFDTSATIDGSVNPNGADTTVVVDYGTTPSFGSQSASLDIGAAAGYASPSTGLSGLTPNTTYHYRLAASNANGTTFGPSQEFTTGLQLTGTAGSPVTGSVDSGVSDGCPPSAVVDWGDGSPTESLAPTCGPGASGGTAFSFVGTHTYANAGHYDITLRACSDCQAVGAGALITPPPAAPGAPAPTPPSVSLETATNIGAGGATLGATVNPDGADTTFVVEYGTSASYGQQTAPVDLGAGSAPVLATQTLSGLAPDTTYHYAFVATNAGGATAGPDSSFTTPAAGITGPDGGTPVALPSQNVDADFFPLVGTVYVDGSLLAGGEQIPFGATVDDTHGTVVIDVVEGGVLDAMEFTGADFKLGQLADGVTVLTLEGGSYAADCGSPASVKTVRETAAAKPGPRPGARHRDAARTVRSLWGNGKGSFEVKGRYAAATVRGTVFHVVDRCDGTFVHVERGIVAVLDDRTGKTTLVVAGQSELVPA